MGSLSLISFALGLIGLVLALVVLFFAPKLRKSKSALGIISKTTIGLTVSVVVLSTFAGILGNWGIGIKTSSMPTITNKAPPLIDSNGSTSTPAEPPDLRKVTLGTIQRKVIPNMGSFSHGKEDVFVDFFPSPEGFRVLDANVVVRSASRANYTVSVSPDGVRVRYIIRAGSALDQYSGWFEADVVATIEPTQ